MSSIDDWTKSPFGQRYVFQTARAAIEAEELGADAIPDLLALNLATNDFVGHEHGPNSPEVLDLSVHTDRMLSEFLNYLNKKVPGGLKDVVVVLTADHGVVPVVEDMTQNFRIGAAKRPKPDAVKLAVVDALKRRFGEAKWVLAQTDGHFYLDRAHAQAKKIDWGQVESTAAEAAMQVDGVQLAMTRSQILQGAVPHWPWAMRTAASYFPPLGGDVVVLMSPGAFPSTGSVTGHGSPWIYDSHVPLVLNGWGIKPGKFHRTVSMNDLAPSLSQLLGISPPSGSIGEPLFEALDTR